MNRIAVLYQSQPNPLLRHARRPWKEGGYSDSSADIAYALHLCGIPLYLPTRHKPHADVALDWTIPDSRESIHQAANAGVDTIWANVPLHSEHPLANAARERALRIVGHLPFAADVFDDKICAAKALQAAGVPVPAQVAVAINAQIPGTTLLESVTEETLKENGLRGPPWMVKPVRGRGSQGVAVVHSMDELHAKVGSFLNERELEPPVSRFGEKYLIEEFLPGDEITIAVLPPGAYGPPAPMSRHHWALPTMLRTGHVNGVLPYSGVTAVSANSAVLPRSDGLADVVNMCEKAAETCMARAVMRVDCRQDVEGLFRVFDVNMKPNLTAEGRPGREGQDSLVVLAASAFGWKYADLLKNLLSNAWSPELERGAMDQGQG